MTEAIALVNVVKAYRRGGETVEVLHDLNLSIPEGEFVAIMGPSGSGKSTLLNIIAGIDHANSGAVTVAGHRIDQMSGSELTRWRSANIGFIFQFYNLMPALSAEANVELPLLLLSLTKAERRARVAAALEAVGLSERARHKPSELSGGQQQRVAIARALVSDPPILVCDEPTGDLDRDTATEVLELLRALTFRRGKTIIMVTHDQRAADTATRQLHVDKGQLAKTELAR
ncbi:ABC transporter ATP-binding protein [Mesorhizobium sp. B2-4-12]|uniref:ABC transporter ATP-binding protein n=1 Tax=unclassified Mesorhizobium TaxID=325217 RepID=UPI00112C87A6|nr:MULTISPECIES: ABC transporter ATP-binding protein [unclassified Mesorhizobium]TPK93915.1 ABC transporter ATP-binding protein [Mesorhizobium sp. B2-4-12]TPL09612.1 ABC transporter ATP-binding protein [Mesorhizobium sp. B2-4-14]